MLPARIAYSLRCLVGRGLLVLVSLLGWGCATQPVVKTPAPVVANLSPAAIAVAPGDAWKLAEQYVAAHPNTQVLVGKGDSMLPLYRDRTVLVVQAMNLSDLRCGMTVVFIGDRGRPVAHTLVKNTPRGWIAMGMGNREPDQKPVQYRNYIGTVVKAYVANPDVPVAVTSSDVSGERVAAVAVEPAPVYFAAP